MLKKGGGGSSATKKKIAAISGIGNSKVKAQQAQKIKSKPAKPSMRKPYGR